MKIRILLFVLCCVIADNLSAQTYQLTHFFLTANSLPQSYNGKLEIGENEVIFTAFEMKDGLLDSTVTREKIIKNKGNYIKTATTGGAVNYEISLSADNKEKANGVYIISTLYAMNSGDRKTFFYKGVLLP